MTTVLLQTIELGNGRIEVIRQSHGRKALRWYPTGGVLAEYFIGRYADTGDLYWWHRTQQDKDWGSPRPVNHLNEDPMLAKLLTLFAVYGD